MHANPVDDSGTPIGDDPVDDVLADIRKKHPGWSIWRARRRGDGLEGVPTGSYVASRLDDGAGTAPTVMADTPAELAEALEQQADIVAAGGEPPLVISDMFLHW